MQEKLGDLLKNSLPHTRCNEECRCGSLKFSRIMTHTAYNVKDPSNRNKVVAKLFKHYSESERDGILFVKFNKGLLRIMMNIYSNSS